MFLRHSSKQPFFVQFAAAAVTMTLLFASVTAPARAEPRQYVIDPEHFSIAIKVMHIGYADMIGLFLEGAGSFTFDEETLALSDVKVTIKTASFTTGHQKRDDHVRSADFLNAKEFPEMTFVGKSSERTGDRTGKVQGELTLRGVTKPLTLNVVWNKSGEYPFGGGLFGGKPYVIGINATASLNRSDFGMTYAVDNGLVGNKVELIFGLEAVRQD